MKIPMSSYNVADYQHINNQDDPTPNQGPPSAIENVGNILGSHHSRLIFINGSQRQKFCSNKIRLVFIYIYCLKVVCVSV